MLDYVLLSIFACKNVSFLWGGKMQFLSKWVLGGLESVNQISCSSSDPMFIWGHELVAQDPGWAKKEGLSLSPTQLHTSALLVATQLSCSTSALAVKSISAADICFLRVNKQPSLPLYSTDGNSNVRGSNSEIKPWQFIFYGGEKAWNLKNSCVGGLARMPHPWHIMKEDVLTSNQKSKYPSDRE